MTRSLGLPISRFVQPIAGCLLLGWFLPACKTYRVAPYDAGDGAAKDGAFEASSTDGTGIGDVPSSEDRSGKDGSADATEGGLSDTPATAIDAPDAKLEAGVDLATDGSVALDADGALLGASASSVNFGLVLQGGKVSSLVPVTVTNVGVLFSGTLSTSIPASEFGIGSDGCKGMVLGPGASCPISLTFSPATATTAVKTVALSVVASPGGSANVVLSGRGVTLALDQTSFAFPATATGNASLSRSFTVTNPTSGSAGVTTGLSVTLTGGSPTDFNVDSTTCSGQLGGTGLCGVSVSFRPGGVSFGVRTATLTVNANPGGTVTAALSGQGQAPDGQFGCATNADCQSAACTTFYRDGDVDGFGDKNKPATVCGFNPPNGYVSASNGLDCDDLDPSMYPGVERCQSSTARAYCPVSGDINQGILQTETCAGGACLDTACLGSVNMSGAIACGSAGNCTAAQGCSFDLFGAPACNRAGSAILNCDDGTDCPAGSVCCSAHACVAFINQSCYAGGCPAGDSCTHYQQLCNPLSPDCPAGTTCKPTFTPGSIVPQGQWGCSP